MSEYVDGSYQCAPGRALIAKVLAGRCKMHYTRAAVGQGTLPDGVSPKDLVEPPGYVMDAKIASITNPVDGECQVTVQINSSDVETGFYANYIILMAEDPDLGDVPYTTLKLEDGLEWVRPSSAAIGKLATFDLIAAVGAVDAVSATIDPEAIASVRHVEEAIRNHNTDPDAHADTISAAVSKSVKEMIDNGEMPGAYHVVAERERDPGKPTYGLGGGGDDGGSVALEAGRYTGTTEVGVVVSGVLYDANNMSASGDNAPDGTIIIKSEE